MNKLKDALKQLKNPTAICKVCFKDFKPYSYRTLLSDVDECNECFHKKDAKFIKFDVEGYKALAIYYYDDALRKLIYQLKGCFDIELANSFLGTYAWGLRLLYFNYYLVFAPSYEEDDKARGFNHVEEIFSCLKLKKLKILKKTKHYKQSDQLSKDRGEIKKYLELNYSGDLQGKRILLVDDIYTTGSTIKACLDLIKTLHPKDIKILVLCKTIDLDKR